MSFSYNMGANPTIDYIRLLISDTQSLNHVFEDEEIQCFYRIQGNTFQSPQFWNAPGGAYLPSLPVSYTRVAALALDSLANNKARLASVMELLDVKLDPSKASAALHSQAEALREIDDNSGAFAIIEQVNDVFSFRDRWWKTVQRESGF